MREALELIGVGLEASLRQVAEAASRAGARVLLFAQPADPEERGPEAEAHLPGTPGIGDFLDLVGALGGQEASLAEVVEAAHRKGYAVYLQVDLPDGRWLADRLSPCG